MANKNLRVKEICKRQGLSMYQLAEKMGIQAGSLAVTMHKGMFNINTLDRMADALGVTIPELFESYTSPSSSVMDSTCPYCGKQVKLVICKTC